jgi:hypothetical protein
MDNRSHTERLSKAKLATLARLARPGDRWVQRKSGRVAVVVTSIDQYSCIGLKHENGRTTSKWLSYFIAEFDPLSDEHDLGSKP